MISEEEATLHKAEEIHLDVKSKIQQYPSYSTYVLQELKWLIADQSGYAKKIANTTDIMEKEYLKLERNAKR